MPVQPGAEHDFWRKAWRQSREVHKYDLGNVFGQVRVAVNQPNRRGIDKFKVTIDEFTEGGLRTISNVISEQLLTLGHVNFPFNRPTAGQDRTKKSNLSDTAKGLIQGGSESSRKQK